MLSGLKKREKEFFFPSVQKFFHFRVSTQFKEKRNHAISLHEEGRSVSAPSNDDRDDAGLRNLPAQQDVDRRRGGGSFVAESASGSDDDGNAHSTSTLLSRLSPRPEPSVRGPHRQGHAR